MCLCFGCGGVGGVGREWVGGLGQGLGGWGRCSVCVSCKSGFSVLMAGPGICIIIIIIFILSPISNVYKDTRSVDL